MDLWGKGTDKNVSNIRHNGVANFVIVAGSVLSAKAEANCALPKKHWSYLDN